MAIAKDKRIMAKNPYIWDIIIVDDDNKFYTIKNVEILNDTLDCCEFELIEKPKGETYNGLQIV